MNVDYLKYQASSIQELLRRKLLQSGVLTDQLYPGSDTKIIIDLFAWTYDVLTYILNNNVSDVLFSDTHLYQNLNRLVKLLSYNPGGYKTSQCQFNIQLNEREFNNLTVVPDVIYIPKYVHFNSGKKDKNGDDICYSFINQYIINLYSYVDKSSGKRIINLISQDKLPVLYNGKYKKYIETFIANGIQYDTFTLGLLDLTSENKIYVDHDLFQIYTQQINAQTGKKQYIVWNRTQNLTLNASQDDYMFQMRLNQNKQYVLKFGNGIHGKIPEEGAYIHILYFQSNGQQGIIDTKQFESSDLILNIDGFSNNIDMFNSLFKNQQNFNQLYGSLFITNNIFSDKCSKLKFINTTKSSSPKQFENNQSIKENAPIAYRRGQRLITEYDYQSFIKQKYGSIIYDAYAANNNYYITVFYNWLKKYGKLNVGIRQYYYKYADACDFNNIYLWLVSANDSKISVGNLDMIISQCNKYKCATSQIVPLNAIITKFVPFVQHSNSIYSYKNVGISLNQYLNRIKIQIYKNQTAIISNQNLRQLVNDKIVTYFKKQNKKIGCIINLNQITAQLLKLGYIKSIKTVNIPENNSNQIEYVNGLSFAAYTTQLIGNADFTVFTGTYSLENFQFPQLYLRNVLNMIEIIDNSYDITNVEL